VFHRSILTVTTAATAAERRLCTPDQVAAELGSEPVAQDYLILPYIDAASDQIASFCRRVLVREVLREVWRPDMRQDAWVLARRPVTAIASVVEDGATLLPAQYELDADAAILFRLEEGRRISFARATLEVNYTAGYVGPNQGAATLPYDVQRAAVLLAVQSYMSRGRDQTLRSVNVPGVVAESYMDPRAGNGGMPASVAEMLAPYRDWPV
jgi:uncharacterized phiE125 gp8 family phage protein